ncbi:hypothetical protein [Anabaena lutea]|uniref:Uncharacterized protein n=1 Tax=Anabaena lutea FACHB-196 TaxID=2692881 RepID=A0ABR8FJV3_9NOST|nr:hypothetical protein [Anabaena lutea]MBD2569873.1 hypothetical protein [Anabaena lutea FACHB-196]
MAEEESFRGGAVPPALLIGVAGGVNALSAAIAASWDWLRQDGNGIIYGDRKNSSSDLRRAGKDLPDDLPNSDWNWGVRDGNKWVIGGRSGQKP